MRALFRQCSRRTFEMRHVVTFTVEENWEWGCSVLACHCTLSVNHTEGWLRLVVLMAGPGGHGCPEQIKNSLAQTCCQLPIQGHSVDLVAFLFHLSICNLIAVWPDLTQPWHWHSGGHCVWVPFTGGENTRSCSGSMCYSRHHCSRLREQADKHGAANGHASCLEPLLVTNYK